MPTTTKEEDSEIQKLKALILTLTHQLSNRQDEWHPWDLRFDPSPGGPTLTLYRDVSSFDLVQHWEQLNHRSQKSSLETVRMKFLDNNFYYGNVVGMTCAFYRIYYFDPVARTILHVNKKRTDYGRGCGNTKVRLMHLTKEATSVLWKYMSDSVRCRACRKFIRPDKNFRIPKCGFVLEHKHDKEEFYNVHLECATSEN